LSPEEHLFDLLQGQEVAVEKQAGKQVVRQYLPRDGIACLGQFRKRLSVVRQGDALQAEVLARVGPVKLVVSDPQGQELLSQTAQPGRNPLDLSSLPAEAQPACVKLLRNGLLLDIAEVPAKLQGPEETRG